MKHTLIDIVKDTKAILTHVCEGKVYYQITVGDSIYQLELDSLSDDWKTTYFYPEFKSIYLMRWIRKGMENGKFIQLN